MTAIQKVSGHISLILRTQGRDLVLRASDLLPPLGCFGRKIFCAQPGHCCLQICQLYLFCKQFKTWREQNCWEDFTTSDRCCKKHPAPLPSSPPLVRFPVPTARTPVTTGIPKGVVPTHGTLPLGHAYTTHWKGKRYASLGWESINASAKVWELPLGPSVYLKTALWPTSSQIITF